MDTDLYIALRPNTFKAENHRPFMKSQSECQRENLILLVFVQFGLLMMAETGCQV